MLYDTISFGSATLDLFLKSKQFRVQKREDGSEDLCLSYGGKMDVDDFAIQSGGGATNTAVAFARMGLRSAVVSELGTDLASKVIVAELKEEGVDTSFLVQEKEEDTAVSALLISSSGGRSAVTARGASKMLTVSDVPFEKLRSNWMHISSLGNVELLLALAAHNKNHRIRFSWNPGGAELESITKGELHLQEIYPTLFCVNEEEAQKILDAGYSLETAGETVIITNGKEGGRYHERGNWKTYQPLSTKALQETGAGDAFISGVVSGYLFERQTEEAIEWGKKNAASVVQHMGAKTGLLFAKDFGL